jgi:hypothetical protein
MHICLLYLYVFYMPYTIRLYGSAPGRASRSLKPSSNSVFSTYLHTTYVSFIPSDYMAARPDVLAAEVPSVLSRVNNDKQGKHLHLYTYTLFKPPHQYIHQYTNTPIHQNTNTPYWHRCPACCLVWTTTNKASWCCCASTSCTLTGKKPISNSVFLTYLHETYVSFIPSAHLHIITI